MFAAFKHVIKILLLSLTFVLCSTSARDLKKCSINDWECQKGLYQTIISGRAKNGMPEYGIPPYDPYVVRNVSVQVQDLLEIGMVDGIAKGIKNCVIQDVSTKIGDKTNKLDILCDLITVKGKYWVSSKPLLKTILGDEVRGDGFGRVDLENLRIRSEYKFLVRQGDDDEIYFDYKHEETKFTFNTGKVKFAANNLFIGDQDISKMIVNVLNTNWKFIMTSFGQPFYEKVMEIFDAEAHKFFDSVPAKSVILEDMSAFV